MSAAPRRRTRATNRRARPRRAVVLVVVVVVIVIVSLLGFSFIASVGTEYKSVRVQGRQTQLDLVAASGVEYLKAFFSQPPQRQMAMGGSRDNAERFRGVTVLDDPEEGARARFSIVAPPGGDEPSSGIRFGVENESARLHLGALLAWDQREPGAAHRALMNLPGMTDAVADAILDWCDADSSTRGQGAEADYYQGIGAPYVPRNGLPQCLDELLLVRGVSRALLFGSDATTAPAGGAAARRTLDRDATGKATPWASLLTVASGERNRSVDGRRRINLNGENLASLHAELLQALDRPKADFVVFYRQYGPYAGPPAAAGAAAAPGPPAPAPPVNLSLPSRFTFTSILDLVDAKVRVTPPGAVPSAPTPPGTPAPPVVTSPWATASSELRTELPKLLDRAALVTDPVFYGQINVNLASKAVLRCVPGIDASLCEQIVTARTGRGAGDGLERRYPTWLLTERLVDLRRMKALLPYLTCGGDVVRAQVVAFFDQPGPVFRAEVVVDATTRPARQVYWKDLRLLGAGYPLAKLGAETLDARGVSGSRAATGPRSAAWSIAAPSSASTSGDVTTGAAEGFAP